MIYLRFVANLQTKSNTEVHLQTKAACGPAAPGERERCAFKQGFQEACKRAEQQETQNGLVAGVGGQLPTAQLVSGETESRG